MRHLTLLLIITATLFTTTPLWANGSQISADKKVCKNKSCDATCPSSHPFHHSGACKCNNSCLCSGNIICHKESGGNGGSKSVSCSGQCKREKPAPSPVAH